MLNKETIGKLKEFKLAGMAEQYEIQEGDSVLQNLSFDQRFELMVDAEYDRRKSNRLHLLLKQATFQSPRASVEDIEYFGDRKLDEELITRLASGANITPSSTLVFQSFLMN